MLCLSVLTALPVLKLTTIWACCPVARQSWQDDKTGRPRRKNTMQTMTRRRDNETTAQYSATHATHNTTTHQHVLNHDPSIAPCVKNKPATTRYKRTCCNQYSTAQHNATHDIARRHNTMPTHCDSAQLAWKVDCATHQKSTAQCKTREDSHMLRVQFNSPSHGGTSLRWSAGRHNLMQIETSQWSRRRPHHSTTCPHIQQDNTSEHDAKQYTTLRLWMNYACMFRTSKGKLRKLNLAHTQRRQWHCRSRNETPGSNTKSSLGIGPVGLTVRMVGIWDGALRSVGSFVCSTQCFIWLEIILACCTATIHAAVNSAMDAQFVSQTEYWFGIWW